MKNQLQSFSASPRSPLPRRLARPGLIAVLGTMLTAALSLAPASGVHAQQQHGLPLVNSADRSQAGLVRIINRTDKAGTVRIHAVDDDGDRFGPVDLSIGRLATVQFNSSELEDGNPAKGLSGGVGDGDGDWRLELTSDLDIEALAYIRTDDGFVTSVHDVVQGQYVPARVAFDDAMVYHVQYFNTSIPEATATSSAGFA